MRRFIVLFGLFLFMSSCTKEAEYRSIDDFRIVDGKQVGLSNGDAIEVLVSSYAGHSSLDHEAYLQLVVRSTATGHYYNILTTSNFDLGRGNNVRDYIEGFPHIEHFSGEIDSELREKVLSKTLKLVLYDSKYEADLINDYPTVYGSVGRVTNNSED